MDRGHNNDNSWDIPPDYRWKGELEEKYRDPPAYNDAPGQQQQPPPPNYRQTQSTSHGDQQPGMSAPYAPAPYAPAPDQGFSYNAPYPQTYPPGQQQQQFHQPHPQQQPPPPYHGLQPGYPGQHQQQPQQQVTVIQQPGPRRGYNRVRPNGVRQSYGAHPPSHLWFAIGTAICCNPLFGLVGVVFSLVSYCSAEDGKMEAARKYGKISMVVCIVGIIVSICISIALTIYYVVTKNSSSVSLASIVG